MCIRCRNLSSTECLFAVGSLICGSYWSFFHFFSLLRRFSLRDYKDVVFRTCWGKLWLILGYKILHWLDCRGGAQLIVCLLNCLIFWELNEGHWSTMPLCGLSCFSTQPELFIRQIFRRSEEMAMWNYLPSIRLSKGERWGLLTDQRRLRDEQPWGEQLFVYTGLTQI